MAISSHMSNLFLLLVALFFGKKTVTCRSPQAAATSSSLPSLPFSALTAFTRERQTRASRRSTLRSILSYYRLPPCLDSRVKCLTCHFPASAHPPTKVLITLDSEHGSHTAQSTLTAPPHLHFCPIPQPIHLLSQRLFNFHCFLQVRSLLRCHSSSRYSQR